MSDDIRDVDPRIYAPTPPPSYPKPDNNSKSSGSNPLAAIGLFFLIAIIIANTNKEKDIEPPRRDPSDGGTTDKNKKKDIPPPRFESWARQLSIDSARRGFSYDPNLSIVPVYPSHDQDYLFSSEFINKMSKYSQLRQLNLFSYEDNMDIFGKWINDFVTNNTHINFRATREYAYANWLCAYIETLRDYDPKMSYMLSVALRGTKFELEKMGQIANLIFYHDGQSNYSFNINNDRFKSDLQSIVNGWSHKGFDINLIAVYNENSLNDHRRSPSVGASISEGKKHIAFHFRAIYQMSPDYVQPSKQVEELYRSMIPSMDRNVSDPLTAREILANLMVISSDQKEPFAPDLMKAIKAAENKDSRLKQIEDIFVSEKSYFPKHPKTKERIQTALDSLVKGWAAEANKAEDGSKLDGYKAPPNLSLMRSGGYRGAVAIQDSSSLVASR